MIVWLSTVIVNLQWFFFAALCCLCVPRIGYWNAIVGNGGTESQCGWCKDRWGLSWQITPRALTDALAAGGGEAKRAFEAMMTMTKIDIAAIEAARRG
jgi:hypothetical protein